MSKGTKNPGSSRPSRPSTPSSIQSAFVIQAKAPTTRFTKLFANRPAPATSHALPLQATGFAVGLSSENAARSSSSTYTRQTTTRSRAPSVSSMTSASTPRTSLTSVGSIERPGSAHSKPRSRQMGGIQVSDANASNLPVSYHMMAVDTPIPATSAGSTSFLNSQKSRAKSFKSQRISDTVLIRDPAPDSIMKVDGSLVQPSSLSPPTTPSNWSNLAPVYQGLLALDDSEPINETEMSVKKLQEFSMSKEQDACVDCKPPPSKLSIISMEPDPFFMTQNGVESHPIVSSQQGVVLKPNLQPFHIKEAPGSSVILQNRPHIPAHYVSPIINPIQPMQILKANITTNQPTAIKSATTKDMSSLEQPHFFRGQGMPIRTKAERDASPEKINLSQKNLSTCPIFLLEERLRLLNLQNNTIARIENLGPLVNLVFLDLFNNRVQEISGLETLSQLRVLMLGRNHIQRLQNLETLTKLDVLDLHGNRIRVLEGISQMGQLRVLNLEDNLLESIPTLRLEGLCELNLRQNKIKAFDSNTHLTQLKRLNLSRNEFGTFDQLIHVWSLSNISELCLESNPFVQAIPDTYRTRILSRMPTLKTLDQRRILDEERRISLRVAKREQEKKQELQKRVSQLEERNRCLLYVKLLWERYIKGQPSPDLEGKGGDKKKALVELENHQLFIYGNGLAMIEKVDPENVVAIHLEMVQFKLVRSVIPKLDRFLSLTKLSFGPVGLVHIREMDPLFHLKTIKSLYISPENPIVQLSVFRHYVTFRMSDCLEKLCAWEISKLDRASANARFGHLKSILNNSQSRSLCPKSIADATKNGFSILIRNAVLTYQKRIMLDQIWKDLVLETCINTMKRTIDPDSQMRALLKPFCKNSIS